MSEQLIATQAKDTYETLCHTLDALEWSYNKCEEDLRIECYARGEDLPIDITVRVDAERMLVLLISNIPFVVGEDKRLDVAIAVSAINNMLVDGSFDFNIATGQMFFRMTNSFIESKLSESVFAYMLYCSCETVDAYNDKLLMIAKGMLSMESFLASL